jgi:hypothetical protein
VILYRHLLKRISGSRTAKIKKYTTVITMAITCNVADNPAKYDKRKDGTIKTTPITTVAINAWMRQSETTRLFNFEYGIMALLPLPRHGVSPDINRKRISRTGA